MGEEVEYIFKLISVHDSHPKPQNNGRPNYPPPPPSSNKHVIDIHDQINDVRSIAKQNVASVLKRDEKLSHLDARAQDLQSGAQSFKSVASKLKRKVGFYYKKSNPNVMLSLFMYKNMLYKKILVSDNCCKNLTN